MKLFFGIFTFLILCIIVGVGGTLWVFWSFGRDLPDYAKLVDYEPPVVTRIHAGDGALLAEYATEKRLFMPTKAMPPNLIAAFLSAEDKSFYQHFGAPIPIPYAQDNCTIHTKSSATTIFVHSNKVFVYTYVIYVYQIVMLYALNTARMKWSIFNYLRSYVCRKKVYKYT